MGILSLSILPLLLLGHLAGNPRIYPKVSLEVNLPPPDVWGEIEREGFDIDIPPKGEWKQFQFGANEVDNVPTLMRLHEEIKRFVASHDTLQSIHIFLDRKVAYSVFIKVLDILQLEKVPRYALAGTDIWVPRFPRRMYFPSGDTVFFPSPPPLTLSDIVRQISHYWQDRVMSLPPILLLAWLGIFYINIRRLRKFRSPGWQQKQT